MLNIASVLVTFFAILIVYMAVLVTYHIIRSEDFETKQKAMIVALAWLIPVIGPAFIISVLIQDKPESGTPGLPWLQFLFLSALFTQNPSSDTDISMSSSSDTTGFDTGDSDGDAGD